MKNADKVLRFSFLSFTFEESFIILAEHRIFPFFKECS